MRRVLVCAAFVAGTGILAWIAAAMNRAEAADPAKPVNAKPAIAKPAASDDLIVGEPIRFENLTIFPLSSRTPKNDNRFTTLDEGLKNGTVQVKEINSQAQVNQLALVNHSKKPLYLMPGEIIVGGQQDRTIAQEYVIPPGPKPVQINVYCVEHGRWVGRGAAELRDIVTANDGLAINGSVAFDATARASAQPRAVDPQHAGPPASAEPPRGNVASGVADPSYRPGEFIGSVGNVGKGARIAVQGDKNQVKVWNKVAETNSLNSNEAPSGDFAGNYLDKKSVDRLEPYFKAMDKKVAEESNVVGVAVAVNGKMDTLDVFESTPLFHQLWPKLLKSYALDAATEATGPAKQQSTAKAKSQAEPVCTPDDARKFLAEAMSAPANQSTTSGGVAVTTLSTDHIVTFCAKDAKDENADAKAAPSAGGVGGAGMGLGGYSGSIHTFGGSK